MKYKKVDKAVFNVENVKALGFEKFAEQHSFLTDPKHVYETVTGEKVQEKKEESYPKTKKTDK